MIDTNPVLGRLRRYIAILEPEQRDWMGCRLLREAAEEIERLLRGDFTESEFQGLCHNFSADDAERFWAGCVEYQQKLFGTKAE